MSFEQSAHCPNCEAPLNGPYCSFCGQRQIDLERPFRDLGAEAIDAFLSLDARLLRTMWPLLRWPGFLTLEFLDGRRARYVHPLKLYFALSVLLFLAVSLSGYSIVKVTGADDPVLTVDGAAVGGRVESGSAEKGAGEISLAERIFKPLGEQLHRDPDRLGRMFADRLAKTIILVVPVFAVILKLLYWRRRYIAHLVFSLHLHSFAFLAILAGFVVDLALHAPREGGPGSGLAGLVIVAYTFFALRRFSGQGRLLTIVKMMAVFVTYLTALLVTMFSTLVLTAFTI
jgi:hypothetical protein